MKPKLTFNFIMSVMSIIVFITLFNVLVLISLLLYQAHTNNTHLSPANSVDTAINPEEYVLGFKDYIIYDTTNSFQISDDGIKSLDSNNAWIQILNEDGYEVFNYNLPISNPKKYTPFDIIDYYKYSKPSTMFIGSFSKDDTLFSYFIGFPYNYISKNIIIYNKNQFYKVTSSLFILMIFIDIVIAGLFGLLYSLNLTKPVDTIIESIDKLSNSNYEVSLEERGIYKDVNQNINMLSKSLAYNDRERKNLDILKEEWISNISHDIKTPLSSIKGYSELISGDYNLTNDEIISYSNIICEKSIYIEDVVNDLNLSSRLKNKSIMLNIEKINIVSFIRDIVIEIVNNNTLDHKNIEFISDSNFIEASIDPVLFKRVIYNIITNAISHNDSNVKIKIILNKTNTNTHIRIIDNGSGINSNELPNIFNRYYRGTNTRSKGSGLGLAISNDIIKYHNAKILVSSVPNKKTEFTIII